MKVESLVRATVFLIGLAAGIKGSADLVDYGATQISITGMTIQGVNLPHRDLFQQKINGDSNEGYRGLIELVLGAGVAFASLTVGKHSEVSPSTEPPHYSPRPFLRRIK